MDHEQTHGKAGRGRSRLARALWSIGGRLGGGGRPRPATGACTGGCGDGVDRSPVAVAGRHYRAELGAARRQQRVDELERVRPCPPVPSDADVDAYEELLERVVGEVDDRFAAQGVWPYQDVVDREA